MIKDFSITKNGSFFYKQHDLSNFNDSAVGWIIFFRKTGPMVIYDELIIEQEVLITYDEQ